MTLDLHAPHFQARPMLGPSIIVDPEILTKCSTACINSTII